MRNSVAIRTFYDYEKQGITVVPSAKAANFTMNRKAIRDLAAKEWVKTATTVMPLQPTNCKSEKQ
jgi:formate-dependent phosphoribosylglycinamide formyltransferase (GAR transformylase)